MPTLRHLITLVLLFSSVAGAQEPATPIFVESVDVEVVNVEVFVTDGEAEITVDGAVHRVTAGEMIELPAGRPHALKAIQRFKMVLVMIRE